MTERRAPRTEGPELALIGAFPFPLPQGSQVYAADQARALAHAGARPTLFTYGRGQGAPPDDLRLAPAPRWTAPRQMRSGPRAGKPLADAALLATYARAARGRFDFALAHNAEAAWIGLTARPVTGVPVVYVAHTLLRHELSAYGAARYGPSLGRVGRRIDALVARRADGVLALSDAAAAALGPVARGPVAVIPPGRNPDPLPDQQTVARACARHGLCPQSFFLYAGNLDGYQDLDLLADAAARLPAGAPPVVVATHDARGAAGAPRDPTGRLRVVVTTGFDEVRALSRAARVLVLTRRRPGGFPVKLLNYMEAARPIVAFTDVAVGLVDGESARLLTSGAGAGELAAALTALDRDPATRERLGEGAHRVLVERHDWSEIAQRTLDFLAELPR